MSVSKRVRFEIFKRDGFRCRYCGCYPESAELRVDHVHPICEGGTDSPSNLVTACNDCNAGKSGVLLHSHRYTGLIERRPVVIEHDELFERATIAAVERASRISFQKAFLGGRSRQTESLEASLENELDPSDVLPDLYSALGRFPSVQEQRKALLFYGPYGVPE